MTTTVTVAADDFSALGAVPSAGTQFMFNLVNPSINPMTDRIISTKSYSLTLDSSGAGSVQIPDAVIGNGVQIWSSLAGWQYVYVAGYPAGTITITDLVNGYKVDPTSLAPSDAPKSWDTLLTSLTARVTALEAGGGGGGGASYLAKASNLSDLANAAAARTNLGLGSAATQSAGAFDAAGAAAAEQTRAMGVEATHTTNIATNATAIGKLTFTPTAVKTTAYTAAAQDLVLCDATTAGFTVTIPTGLADGAEIAVKKIDTSTNVITVQLTGADVYNRAGGATSRTLTLTGEAATLRYQSSTGIWVTISGDTPLAGLDARYPSLTAYNTAFGNLVVVLPAPIGGTSDDGPALNTAIAASPVGSVITAPPGSVYNIGTPLTFQQGREYRFGSGRPNQNNSPMVSTGNGGTIFRMLAGANLDYIAATPEYASTTITTMGAPILMSGAVFDGNKANQTGGAGFGFVCLGYRNTIRDCMFLDTRGHGMVLTGIRKDGTTMTSSLTSNAFETRIIACTFEANGGDGFYSDTHTDGYILDSTFGFMNHNGVEIMNGIGWQVRGNHTYSVGITGILIQALYAGVVAHNYMESFGNTTAIAWSSATTYNMYDIVVSAGALYTSRVDSNLNNTPASSPSQWRVYTSGVSPSNLNLANMGGTRANFVHDNVVHIGHPTQALNSLLTYRVINLNCGNGNIINVFFHHNSMGNEYRSGASNTQALRVSMAGSGTFNLYNYGNAITGGTFGTANNIDAAVTQNPTTLDPFITPTGTAAQYMSPVATSATAATWQRPIDVQPSDHGLISWCMDPALVSAVQLTPAAGTLYLVRLYVPVATTITNVILSVSTAGATLTAGQCFAALYNAAGTLLSATADQATNWQTAGNKVMALSSAQAVAAGTYYVGFYANGTTLPQFRCGSTSTSMPNMNLATASSRFGSADTGLTTAMPATRAAIGAQTFPWWAGLS